LYITNCDGEQITLGAGEGNISASIVVNSEEFYKRCILFGDIGFGEAYVEGLWDTDNITNGVKWFLYNVENSPGLSCSKLQAVSLNLLKWYNNLVHLKRSNTVAVPKKNISGHYYLNNNIFPS